MNFRQLLLLLFTLSILLAGCSATRADISLYPVEIVNESSHDICSVKFYHSSSYHTYAKNLLKAKWLRTENIQPHQTRELFVPAGLYDIRIKTCDGYVWGQDSFSVPEEKSWTITDDSLFIPVR